MSNDNTINDIRRKLLLRVQNIRIESIDGIIHQPYKGTIDHPVPLDRSITITHFKKVSCKCNWERNYYRGKKSDGNNTACKDCKCDCAWECGEHCICNIINHDYTTCKPFERPIYSIPSCVGYLENCQNINSGDRRKILFLLYVQYWLDVEHPERITELFKLLKCNVFKCRCHVIRDPKWLYNTRIVDKGDLIKRIFKCSCHGQLLKLILYYILCDQQRFEKYYRYIVLN